MQLQRQHACAFILTTICTGMMGCPTIELARLDTPHDPCVGDQLTLEFKTSFSDTVQIRSRSGEVLFETNEQDGMATVRPIYDEDLPLWLRAINEHHETEERFRRKRSWAVGDEPIVLIDENPVWTSATSITPYWAREDEQVGTTTVGTVENVPVYDVYMVMEEFRWQLSSDEWGSSARFIALKNVYPAALRFTGPALQGMVLIEPNAILEFNSPVNAGGTWVGRLDEPIREKVGTQVGDDKIEMPEGNFENALIQFRTICDG